ncbi:16S rRNA (guanine(527)-N(7))-methyltransferase RsmG [Candidatus Clostridium stratigraminis]|uniref:Ribosomal RNA small subunit methyltransferase G n=1 Tax=Candidatus Clostridium stratigraminis TaxID=3381661 RepID=A0ABW8T7T2_9CLOT
MEFFDMLNEACFNEGLAFDENKYNKLIKYKDMLKEWNEKVNLTAITDDEGIIKKHFIDSLKIFRFSKLKSFKRIIDVGTGAGFPGIPMKILIPEMEIVLLDSLNKRINFLNEVISHLNLDGITAVHGRAEDFARENNYRESFDAAVSRAVANLSVLSELCIPFIKKNGYFIALKGPAVEEEINEAGKAIKVLGGQIESIIPVTVEGTDLNHNLVVVNKINHTAKEYPRKAGVVAKKPLK